MSLESRKLKPHGWHYFSEIVRNKKCGSHKCQMLALADCNVVALSFVTRFSSNLINYFYTIHTDHIFNIILTRRDGIFRRTLPHDRRVFDKEWKKWIWCRWILKFASCKLSSVQILFSSPRAESARAFTGREVFDASDKFFLRKRP